MSEIYPKFQIQEGTPLDVERVNENFREVVQEVNGKLSESNFAAQTIESNRISEGALLRFHKFYEPGSIVCQRSDVTVGATVEPYAVGRLPNTASGFSAPRGGCINLPLNNTWTTVAKGTITARTGLVWVMASWQQTYNVPDGREEISAGSSGIFARSDERNLDTEDRYRFFPGVQYCLSIDGARITETTVGGLDSSNDPYGDAYALWHMAGVTDMIFPISAGQRTISLEARIPMANTNHPQFTENRCFYTIASRELIILEMY